MATENTGGWQLTTSTYALGGRMETVGATARSPRPLNNPQTKPALECLKDMRWDDNSMGSTFDYAWGIDQPGVRVRPDRHVHRRLRPLHRDGPEQRPQARRLRHHDHPARERPERRRPRWRHARRGQRRHHRRPARRGGRLDRLLLHAEAADPGRRRRRCRGAQGQQPAGRRPGPADLRQGHLRRSRRRGSRTTSTSRPPR